MISNSSKLSSFKEYHSLKLAYFGEFLFTPHRQERCGVNPVCVSRGRAITILLCVVVFIHTYKGRCYGVSAVAAKGGVRKEYLSLFLGEYVWRYNYRLMEINQKVNRLLKLLEDFSG